MKGDIHYSICPEGYILTRDPLLPFMVGRFWNVQ